MFNTKSFQDGTLPKEAVVINLMIPLWEKWDRTTLLRLIRTIWRTGRTGPSRGRCSVTLYYVYPYHKENRKDGTLDGESALWPCARFMGRVGKSRKCTSQPLVGRRAYLRQSDIGDQRYVL
jgi:hypothetical protein